jgi:hypothetical protein
VDTSSSGGRKRHNNTSARPKPFFRKHIAEKYLDRIKLLAADFSQGRVTEVSLEVGTTFVRLEEPRRITPPPLPSLIVGAAEKFAQ